MAAALMTWERVEGSCVRKEDNHPRALLVHVAGLSPTLGDQQGRAKDKGNDHSPDQGIT